MVRRANWLYLATLAISFVLGAGPATKPADRVCADGQYIPEVEYRGPTLAIEVNQDNRLIAKLDNLMLQPPEKLDKKIYTTAISAKLIALRMTRRSDVDTVNAENGAFPGGTSTLHGTVTTTDEIGTTYFCWGIDNADVVGFDLDEGVVRRMVVYYRNANTAKELLNEISADPNSPWTVTPDGNSVKIEREIPDIVWYILHHPERGKAIVDAMLHGQLARGMTIEEAKLTLGEPSGTTDSGSVKSYTWKTDHGLFGAICEDGVITTVSHENP